MQWEIKYHIHIFLSLHMGSIKKGEKRWEVEWVIDNVCEREKVCVCVCVCVETERERESEVEMSNGVMRER